MSALNAELAELLAAAGCGDAATLESGWSRVVMVHNVSRIPRGGPRRHGVSAAHRGFNLLVLDSRGEPCHYVKCRPAGDPRLRRETRIMSSLHAHPNLQALVPDAVARASERLEVHVCPYVDGDNLEATVNGLSPRAWEKAASEILLAADRIASVAPSVCDDVPGGHAPLRFESEAQPALNYLARLGLTADDASTLERALSVAGRATPHSQHGDLWPANIVETRDGWRILDFEDYGLIQVPLFDVFHLVRAAPGASSSDATGWYGTMCGPETPWTRAMRTIIRAAVSRRELEHSAVTGALIYYLVSIAARLHERDNPRSVWGPLLQEVELLASQLRTGEAPSRRIVA